MGDGDKPEAPDTLRTIVVESGVPSTQRSAVAPPMPADWRYQERVEIARGGMGRVVEATDQLLGRTVAVKEALTLDADTLARFQRETRITARLEHPAIVPVHDAGTTPNGTPFYVMRKVEGRALEQLVGTSVTLAERLALVRHVVTAANAVAHAHERGIVHRDIKPANILVGELGETIVIDWGLAKAIDEPDDLAVTAPRGRKLDDHADAIKTRAGIVFGTPGFMAPEQLRGKSVDERCDVYALGATLYHLLARRPPHHDKDANVMMRAAVEGPPIPLTEIVPQLPAELATIVDKALAYEPARRYQTARAFAEDLDAYLTGRIVGAHSYTARERLLRFVARNKGAVAVATIAVVAGIAGAALAFVRITDERDRADEQARIAVAEKREADARRDEVLRQARELTLANARSIATAEPTRAAAMVKPFAASDAWRAARDVGAAARASGVAFAIPLAKHTLALELSRDGQRALAAGDDGIVRIVDLDKRTSTEIANVGGAVMARFADGERKIVLWQGNRMTIIDTATNQRREVTSPTAIDKLDVSGPLVYWVDPAKAVWRLDLAAGAPVKLDIAEPITLVAPSPDGRWIAFGGTEHLLLADRSDPTLPPEEYGGGGTQLAAWSSDSRRLAAQVGDEVIDLKVDPAPQVWNRYRVGARYGLAFSGGRVFSSGPLGVGQLFNPDPKLRVQSPGHTLGVHEGRENVVISAKPTGELVVLSDYGDHVLHAPAPIELVATSARGPWVVAAMEGRLLVWSLEQIEPRAFANDPPSSARFVGADSLIVTYQDRPAEWIDLRTSKATSIGELPALQTVVAAPDGAEAIAIDISQRAWRVAGVGQPKALPGETTAAVYLDTTRLVLATDNAIRLDDLAKSTHTTLVAHAEPIELAARGTWVAAAFADGTLWRKDLAAVDATLALPPAKHRPLAVAADGAVIVGVGAELRIWRATGKVDTLVKLGRDISALAMPEPGVAAVVTLDGNVQLVDLASGVVTNRVAISERATLDGDGALIAAPIAAGGVEVADPLTGWKWPLVTQQKGVQRPFGLVEVSRDGSRVLGVSDEAVVVWTLALPKTADETAAWLDRTTNAVADSPSAPLSWR